MIAAGSTGSMPATAALIETIAKLPHGAVVLPGLDTDLDDESWEMIAGVRDTDGKRRRPARHRPSAIRHAGTAQAHRHYARRGASAPRRAGRERRGGGREAAISEAMRPAENTDKWRDLAERKLPLDAALEDVSVIAAANAEEEALAIAVALREAVEIEGKTAALVTPDRALARRVIAALERWQVAVDNSGGDALADTPAGVFARLAAEAALDELEPVTLLALLKHPLMRLGAGPGAHHQAISTLEQALLRGPRPKPGTAGLQHALATFRANVSKLHRADPRARLTPGQLQNAGDLVDALATALAPLEGLAEDKAAADRVRRGPSPGDRQPVQGASWQMAIAFAGHDGKALAEAFEEIAENAPRRRLRCRASDYPDLFRTIVAEKLVRRPDLPGVRVRIYGPAGSAAAIHRPRRARRTGRRRVAAGDAQRSLAQPPDAARSSGSICRSGASH